MGVNQDFGGYSLTMDNSAAQTYGVITDQYSSAGKITLTVYVLNLASFVTYTIDEVSVTVEPTHNDLTGENIIEIDTEIAAGIEFKLEIFSDAEVNINFGEFEMGSSKAAIFNETFNNAFDEIWDVNTFSNDLTTNPGALSWDVFYDGGEALNLSLLASFDIPVDINDLNINHKAYKSMRPLVFFGDSITKIVKMDDYGTIGYSYKASTKIDEAFEGFDNMVYGVGYNWILEAY